MAFLIIYKNLQRTFIFPLFHLLLWLMLCHCYGPDNNHIRRSSFIHLQIDMTHEASEKTSLGHGHFSPILPERTSSPCQGRTAFPGRGWLPRWASWLFVVVLCHSPWSIQNDAKAQKRQPALLLTENSMLIHDSTWAEDLNFIMCFINLRVLEITYNITGSEWISI